MANGDGIVSHQDVFHDEPYDSLAFPDAQRFGSTTQASEECGEGLCQTQEGRLIVHLISDCLQLSAKCLFTLAQRRYPLAQLFD
jgi:hypothetical protein